MVWRKFSWEKRGVSILGFGCELLLFRFLLDLYRVLKYFLVLMVVNSCWVSFRVKLFVKVFLYWRYSFVGWLVMVLLWVRFRLCDWIFDILYSCWVVFFGLDGFGVMSGVVVIKVWRYIDMRWFVCVFERDFLFLNSFVVGDWGVNSDFGGVNRFFVVI